MRFAKQSKGKKNIAVLLVVAMLLTIMPVAAFAVDGTDATATAAMYDGEGNKVTTLFPSTEAQSLEARLTTGSAYATTVYVTWNIGEAGTKEISYKEDIGYSDIQSIVGDTNGTVTATFSTENGELAIAKATIVPEGTVAMIGDKPYKSLDEAVKNSVNGDTIKVLKDCESAGINPVANNLTIVGVGNPTITFVDEAIAVMDPRTLTFKDCVLDLTKATGCAYHETKTITMLLINFNSTLNLDNVDMIMDGSNYSGHGIYLHRGGVLNVVNGSDVDITNFAGYQASGIYCDSDKKPPEATYSKISFKDSYLNISGCSFNGMTVNYADVAFDKTEANLSNNGGVDGRGGFSCYYGNLTVTNGATLKANNNAGTKWAYGLFVDNLDVNNGGSIEACENKAEGINIGGIANIDNTATLILKGNTDAGMRIYKYGTTWAGDCTIEKGANVTITGNKNGGIYNENKLNMQSGVVMFNNTLENGGGIYNVGEATIASDVLLYNNHATVAGDDIFNADKAIITFGVTGDDWELDGAPDCNDKIHTIDGWYDDSEDNRWNAHKRTYHTDKLAEDAQMPITGLKALKAAHGLEFTINKVDAAGNVITSDEATFVLTKEVDNAGKKQTVYYQETDGTINWVADQKDATKLVTNKGTVTVINLPEGDYSIVEIEAPEGYKLAEKAIDVTIDYEKSNPMVINFVNEAAPGAIDGYVFNDVEVEKQRDNIYVAADDTELADVKVSLYQMYNDSNKYFLAGETKTDANGYYKFDNLIPDGKYFVYVERPTAYNRNCDYAYTDSQKDGDRFETSAVVTGENGTALYCSDIITVVANETARANAGFYSVSSSGPDPWTPSNPDPVDPPEEEITDPDVPLVEPDDPTTEIDEPDVPLIDVPGTPVEEIDEPEVPLGDAPKTGDAAPIVGLIGLLIVAVAGLVVVRRKFN